MYKEHPGISARLKLASYNVATGNTLYTFVLRFPTIILAEIMTHRVASKNTSSSRAIPCKTMRRSVLNDPFIPTSVGSHQAGMQAGDSLSPHAYHLGRALYGAARFPALAVHWGMDKLGIHKQVQNRLLVPWQWTEQVFSTTQTSNLLKLRAHEAAEPHFQQLAFQMKAVIEDADQKILDLRSQPYRSRLGSARPEPWVQLLEPGQWHLPFAEKTGENEVEAGKVHSAARCGRVSYLLRETGQLSSYEKDTEFVDRLKGSEPMHLSPFEHPAMAMEKDEWCGNYRGFKQWRKFFPNESGEE
jgi:hypothetical protein